MALRDLFKPGWQHSDARVRLEAIEQLTGPEAEDILKRLATSDSSETVRGRALEKLNPIKERRLLEEMALHDQSSRIRKAALDRLDQNALTHLAKTAEDEYLRLEIVMQKLDVEACQSLLAEIATQDPSGYVRNAATNKLSSPDALIAVAMTKTGGESSFDAVRKITDEKTLQKLAREAGDGSVRAQAVSKIAVKENALLLSIATSDADWMVREAAVKRLDAAANQDELAAIAKEDENVQVCAAAMASLDSAMWQDLFLEIIEKEKRSKVLKVVIAKLDEASSRSVLKTLATENEDAHVRRLAVERLDTAANQPFLEQIASEDKNNFVKRAAATKLAENITNQQGEESAILPIEQIKRLDFEKWQILLSEVARHGKDNFVREAAVINLDINLWQELLVEVARTDPGAQVRRAAVMKLDQNRWRELLMQIESSDQNPYVRKAASLRLKLM
jgi:hypothetical protein